ncbi:hypothetical protein ACCS51_26585 [Rhizobium ruizarguesonis]|jgi:hypothetical protein
MEVNLEDLQHRLNKSRQDFQRAIERYHTEGRSDGTFIVKTYLRKFKDDNPDRAKIAVDIAKETEEEIEKFRSRTSDLAYKVQTALLTGDMVASGATIDSMGEILADASGFLDEIAKRLAGLNSSSPAPSATDLQARLDEQKMKVAKVGESVVSITTLAAAVCNMRCEVLKGFRNDNLEVSREELIRRLRGMLLSIPREEVFERFRKLVQDLLAEYLKKAVPILGGVLWVADKVKKLAQPKAGTNPGDTDIMLTLLPALRKDQQMIDELDRIFQGLVK